MDEEEILSPREIAIIERWMEKHQAAVEEPTLKGPWKLSLVEAVVSAGVSDKRSEIAELPEKLWTKLEEIWTRAYLDCKTYAGARKAKRRLWELLPPSGSGRNDAVLKDGDLANLAPTGHKMVERHLKGIIAGEKRKLTARIEEELAEKTEKLKKGLNQQNGKIERALGQVMEKRDRLEKTLKEERQQWKEQRGRLARRLNAPRIFSKTSKRKLCKGN